MFQLLNRLQSPPPPRQAPQHYLKRALFFSGALVLLWVAVQLMPSSEPDVPATFYSEDSGTVAAKAEPAREERSAFSPGHAAALLLLAGGACFAVYLRRKPGVAGTPDALMHTLGQMQLSPTQELQLVSCGDEVLLLGVGSGQITLLKSFPRDAFPEDAPATAASRAPALSPSFARVLQQYTGTPAAHHHA